MAPVTLEAPINDEQLSPNRTDPHACITTHSPLLLDLYRDHPEEIVLAERHGAEAMFSRLIDKPNAQELLGSAPLGDLWYSGILGGVPIEQ